MRTRPRPGYESSNISCSGGGSSSSSSSSCSSGAIAASITRLLPYYTLLTFQCACRDADVFIYCTQGVGRALLSPEGVAALTRVTESFSEEALKALQRPGDPDRPPVRTIAQLRDAGVVLSLDGLPVPDLGAHTPPVQNAWWDHALATCGVLEKNAGRGERRKYNDTSRGLYAELQKER